MSHDSLKVRHLSKALDLSKAAVELDNAGRLKEALAKYIDASENLMSALKYSNGDASIRSNLGL